MNKDKESKVFFKILDAYLVVKRVRSNPHILTAHNEALSRGILARYNFTRVELKTFTFSSEQSISIDNAVLGPIPKRLIFTMVKNTDFLGTMDSNPYISGITISIILCCTSTVGRFHPRACLCIWVMKRRRLWDIKPCLTAPVFITRTRGFR